MENSNRSKITDLIKSEAIRLGFISCGISKADFLETEATTLEQWLKKGMHGKMSYMENHYDKRLDPRLLVDGALSVISLLLNYYPPEQQQESSYKIAKYAYGKDYHFVIKNKLQKLMSFIQTEVGDISGRAFVDSGPVLEKAWASKSGLGWVGKNGNLISKKTGSFFFIAELILDIKLDYDTPTTNHCGSCTACLDACPTQAIVAPQVVDGSKCVSYFTIELKEAIPSEMKNKFEDWVFGCDICQDVCPWNRFSIPHKEKDLTINPALKTMNKNDWEEITDSVFKEVFRDSPLQRTKWKGLKRNIEFLK